MAGLEEGPVGIDLTHGLVQAGGGYLDREPARRLDRVGRLVVVEEDVTRQRACARTA